MTKNLILCADSYKASQWVQYPPNTETVFSYVESRGGKYGETVFFGLQAFIKEYLAKPITKDMIDEAEEIILAHGEPFNREGWEYILYEHDGFMPVVIDAAPEGSVIPVHNVLATIYNTDPKCYWLPSYLETALLRAIWYPTTVATNSREIKKIINRYLEMTGDPSTIDFKLHDFGARGVSSGESAAIGGMAHLVNFKGTDTIEALVAAKRYYGAEMAGFSIPASEHSTITSWGRENEADAYENMINQFAKPNSIFACVSDSYDIYNACKIWGTFKDKIVASGATLVVRPDSGHPATVVLKCVQILEHEFGSTVNDKGFRVLNNVRVIQGDGVNIGSITEILEKLFDAGYSADNVNFGQGGALLQIVNRDDFRFAMKCSAVYIKDKGWVDVFKDPITDTGKRSKKGLLDLRRDSSGNYHTVNPMDVNYGPSVLRKVYDHGSLPNMTTWEAVRERAKL